MGEYLRYGTQIRCFKPDNNENTLYIPSEGYSLSMSELIQNIQDHFQVDREQAIMNFNIEAEYIHTDCIGYDDYDPTDYTNYICITRM